MTIDDLHRGADDGTKIECSSPTYGQQHFQVIGSDDHGDGFQLFLREDGDNSTWTLVVRPPTFLRLEPDDRRNPIEISPGDVTIR